MYIYDGSNSVSKNITFVEKPVSMFQKWMIRLYIYIYIYSWIRKRRKTLWQKSCLGTFPELIRALTVIWDVEFVIIVSDYYSMDYDSSCF